MARRRALHERRMKSTEEEGEPALLLDKALLPQDGLAGWWRHSVRRAQEYLERTDLQLTTAEALGIVLLCGAVLAVTVFFWRHPADEHWLALPAFFLGALAPLAFFAGRQRAWRRRLQDQLPDTLYLLSRSLRSGLSIDQSIQVIGDHGVKPMGQEFARMARQLELGLALGQVLQISARRVHLIDYNVFTSVVSLHRSTGGSLPVIVDRLAQTTREHNQLRAQYRAATALGRLGNAAIGFMVVLVFLYLMFYQRDLAMRYFDSPTGFAFFALAMGLEVLAVVLLFLMLRSEL
jgi:tight adherence protein B